MARRAHPLAHRISEAMHEGDGLGALLARVAESRARLAVVRSVLPASLGNQVRDGVLDEGKWTLMAPSSAAAAKLKQCVPQIDTALDAAGYPRVQINVKVALRDAVKPPR